ncbi:MAG: Crp/Fnr family transcriptional regulator [Ekhidna sp.]
MILSECLPRLGKELFEEIANHSSNRTYSSQEQIIKQGEIIRFLPIVLSGSVKVYSQEEAIQFLLYYISSGETCIFHFAHIFNDQPVEFSAVAEKESELILLPIHKVQEWHNRYPRFNDVLLKAYQKHYNELLHTTKQVICYNLEDRLIDYLKKKSSLADSELLAISHQDIATDLGTSREVITRLLKKPNVGEVAMQVGRKIKIR